MSIKEVIAKYSIQASASEWSIGIYDTNGNPSKKFKSLPDNPSQEDVARASEGSGGRDYISVFKSGRDWAVMAGTYGPRDIAFYVVALKGKHNSIASDIENAVHTLEDFDPYDYTEEEVVTAIMRHFKL